MNFISKAFKKDKNKNKESERSLDEKVKKQLEKQKKKVSQIDNTQQQYRASS